jgi:hypothetical protein
MGRDRCHSGPGATRIESGSRRWPRASWSGQLRRDYEGGVFLGLPERLIGQPELGYGCGNPALAQLRFGVQDAQEEPR